VVSRWTSSLRPRRDSLAVGACLVAFACPAAGWAAGGTPMPAPDDPPGAFATKSSKPSHGTTPAPSPTKATVPTPVVTVLARVFGRRYYREVAPVWREGAGS